VLKLPLNTNQPQNEVQYFRTKNLGAANLANPFNKRNIEDQRLNNKLTYFYQLLLFLSQYLDVLFNSVIIRKPGTMVTHIGTILGEYRIANGKHQLDNIGPISVISWRKI